MSEYIRCKVPDSRPPLRERSADERKAAELFCDVAPLPCINMPAHLEALKKRQAEVTKAAARVMRKMQQVGILPK